MERPAAGSSVGSTGRAPALDGIRGIAIVAVMLFHTTLPQFGGGYLGVDVFFVLSGYLITTLLARELDRTGTVRFGAFYARRALRLYPALILTVVLFLPFGAGITIFAPTEKAYVEGALWSLVFLSDVPAALHHIVGLQHTWSLAVEEQFYLVWPPVLVLLLRRGRRVLAGRLAVVVAVASAVGFAAFAHPLLFSPPVVYYSPLTHGPTGLMAGAALALWLPTVTRRPDGGLLAATGAGALIAVWLLGWTVTGVHTEAPYIAVTSIGTTLLLAGVLIEPAGPAARALGVRPLRALGRVSYGLYLLHLPTFYLIKGHLHVARPALITVQFAVSIALATASWWLLEKPALRWKERFETTSLAVGPVSRPRAAPPVPSTVPPPTPVPAVRAGARRRGSAGRA